MATPTPAPRNAPTADARELSAAEWRGVAEALWALLDDVDTASDLFKPEPSPYVDYVQAKQAERHRHLVTDGHRLYVP